MRVSVVTPTRDRPEAVELCRRWFREQTRPAHEHIIHEGQASIVENLRAGILRATGDVVLIADDDDHFGPRWVEWISEAMSNEAVMFAGQISLSAFHIRSQRWRTQHDGPLPGMMAFRREHTRLVFEQMDAYQTPKHVFWRRDGDDWERSESGRRLPSDHIATTRTQHVTAIKGLYPSSGWSAGHRPALHPLPDPGRQEIRDRIGDDGVIAYLDAIERIDARCGMQCSKPN